jgi:hypothetical protein
MAFGEKVFLFIWAVVSSTKDLVVDYTTDVLQYVSPTVKPNRTKSKKPQQLSVHDRRRKAYFRRLRHQMGVYTPERDKNSNKSLSKNAEDINDEDDLDNIAANLQNVLGGDDDKQSKLEDLESQLMELKQQLAFIAGKPSPQKHQLKPAPVHLESKSLKTIPPAPRTPSMMNNHANIAASIVTKTTTFVPPPPPPPPLPSFNSAPQNLTSSMPSLRINTNTTSNKMERSMSLADIVRSAKDHKLRPTKDVNRSPNGTPKKGKPVGGFQHELFAAIKSKFRTMNDDEEKKNNDSDSDSDSGFDTPPKAVQAKNKENASPIGKRAASPLQARPKMLPLHTINK